MRSRKLWLTILSLFIFLAVMYLNQTADPMSIGIAIGIITGSYAAANVMEKNNETK